MPNNDKTGPNGQGPLTGRGRGLCNNNNNNNCNVNNNCPRRGFNNRNFARNQFTKDEEIQNLQENLKQIKERLEELEK